MSQGFVGTSINQDFRLKGNKKHNLKIPKILSTRLEISKINRDFLQNFVEEKLSFKDDEILEGLLLELITTGTDSTEIYVQAHEFLQQDTFKVMKEIWEFLVKAQESSLGIPQELVDKKKEELKLMRLKEEEEARKEQELRKKERELWEKEREDRQAFRGRERGDSSRDMENNRDRERYRDSDRERYRDRRDYDSRPSRRERSASRGRDRRRERGRSNSRDRGRGRSFSRDRRTTSRPRSNSRDKSSPRDRDYGRDRRVSRDDSRERYERYARIDRRDDRQEHRQIRNRSEKESTQKRDDSLERIRREPPKPRNYSPEQVRFQRPVASEQLNDTGIESGDKIANPTSNVQEKNYD